MMETVRLGIIGYGNIGITHAKNVMSGRVPDMKLTAVCDISQARLEAFKKTYPNADIQLFEDHESLYKSGLCDVVIIAVPHYDHVPLTIKAFEYGLHVILEKPAGVYTKQVLEMNEAAKKSGKLFGIVFCQRTNPLYQKIRELVHSGELGTIKRVQWTITDWYRPQSYHDSCTWRSTWKTEGGGALINQNPHQLDLWQWMFGMPKKIMAHMSFGKYYDIEVEDDVTAYMEYENGMTGVYITSTGEAPGTNRLEIACDMGRVVAENNMLTFKRNVVSEREYNKTFKGVFAKLENWNCEIPVTGIPGEQHAGILKDFVKVLKNGGELLAPGYEGIKSLTISNAMHYSAWTDGWADLENFPHDDFLRLLNEHIEASTVVKEERQISKDTEGSY